MFLLKTYLYFDDRVPMIKIMRKRDENSHIHTTTHRGFIECSLFFCITTVCRILSSVCLQLRTFIIEDSALIKCMRTSHFSDDWYAVPPLLKELLDFFFIFIYFIFYKIKYLKLNNKEIETTIPVLPWKKINIHWIRTSSYLYTKIVDNCLRIIYCN